MSSPKEKQQQIIEDEEEEEEEEEDEDEYTTESNPTSPISNRIGGGGGGVGEDGDRPPTRPIPKPSLNDENDNNNTTKEEHVVVEPNTATQALQKQLQDKTLQDMDVFQFLMKEREDQRARSDSTSQLERPWKKRMASFKSFIGQSKSDSTSSSTTSTPSVSAASSTHSSFNGGLGHNNSSSSMTTSTSRPPSVIKGKTVLKTRVKIDENGKEIKLVRKIKYDESGQVIEPKKKLVKKARSLGIDTADEFLPSTPRQTTIYSKPQFTNELKNIYNEIVDSETVFVRHLNYLCWRFVYPLRRASIISEEEIQKVFSNLENLRGINEQLLQDIMQWEAEKSQQSFGDIFLKMSSLLKLYAVYCSNYDRAIKEAQRLMDTNKNFNQFVVDAKAKKESRKLSLIDYLAVPFQRITKYPLLFRELVAATPQTDPEKPKLMQVLEEMKHIAHYVNERSVIDEAKNQVIEIDQKLTNTEGFSLVTPSRYFIKDGSFTVYYKHDKEKYQVFLFSDCLLFTQQQNDKYEFRRLILLDSFTELAEKIERDGKFGFELIDLNETKRKKFVLCAKTTQIRDSWMETIQKLCLRNKQAEAIRLAPFSIKKSQSLEDANSSDFKAEDPSRTTTTTSTTTTSSPSHSGTNSGHSSTTSSNLPSPDSTPLSPTMMNDAAFLQRERRVSMMNNVAFMHKDKDNSDKQEQTQQPVAPLSFKSLKERPRWVPDSECKECSDCGIEFTVVTRRHHCRSCGNLFCGVCCSKKVPIIPLLYFYPVRVCNKCYATLKQTSAQQENQIKASKSRSSTITETKK